MTKDIENKIDSYINDECCVEEVGITVQRLVRVFQLFERDQIKVFGFTSSQCYSMLELLKSDSLSMYELSEKMNLNTSTMTRIVDKLVRDKYITRERYEEDKRVVIVKLSDKGKKAAQEMNEGISSYYKNIIDNIPKGKVDEVLKSVGVLLDAFEKANPNCC